jgi:geranylgeranyl diphosphate synthase type I
MSPKRTNPTSFLKEYKPTIDRYLQQLLDSHRQEYAQHFWAKDVFDYLQKFSTKGKSVRSALLFELAKRLDNDSDPNNLMPLAAMVELIHSGLLIQDDFMDNDTQRRGMDSLYYKYQQYAEKHDLHNQHLFGISLSTCVSDICFFIAFGQLAALQIPAKTMSRIHRFIHKEYVHVGLAQMTDAHFGYLHNGSTLADIETVNMFKTARYTFSLPFGLVALYLGLPARQQKTLELAGEKIGILFQIRDDYLSLFGDSTVTGKPLGSDIIEDKKTIYRHLLFKALEKADQKKRMQLKAIFGKKKLTKKEIQLVQKAIIQFGVEKEIANNTQKYQKELRELLQKSSLDSKVNTFLLALCEFVTTRNK